MTGPESTLYFHKQCFDGIASAVICRAYLVEHEGWPQPTAVPIGYELQREWLKTPFARWTAVVDFLFHPEARFWADHHETTFAGGPPAQMRKGWFYDPTADSCAGLLARTLTSSAPNLRRFAELARWADVTDAAHYQSPEEALFPPAPALIVNGALADASPDECSSLVAFLSTQSLAQAAALPWIVAKTVALETRVRAGLKLLKGALRVDGGVASFIVDSPPDVLIHRYAPYVFAPDARYSAGPIRLVDRIRLSVMRNPWIDFESIHLGSLCARFGGGGHQRVGAATFAPAEHEKAQSALREIVRIMREHTAAIIRHDRAV
jgi:hypothetical protein